MEFLKHNKQHTACTVKKKDLPNIYQDKKQPSFFNEYPRDMVACVYLLDNKKKLAFVYSSKASLPCNFKADLVTNPIHMEAHKKALGGKKVTYTWYCQANEKELYQSIVMPLSSEGQNNDLLLGIVKLVTSVASTQNILHVAETPAPSFSQMIMMAREEEKRQIASILHDELGSSAVFINSLLTLLREDIKDDKKKDALENVKNVEQALDQSIDRIKKIIISLRPPQLADIGLNAAVKELVETLADTTPVKFHYNYEVPDSTKMSDTVKITLYRVVQEATNNALKHAQAHNISIDIQEDKSLILLTVTDDGIGFTPGKYQSIKKLGLLGMREGIDFLGGTLKIQTHKGEGTVITVLCPKVSYTRNI